MSSTAEPPKEPTKLFGLFEPDPFGPRSIPLFCSDVFDMVVVDCCAGRRYLSGDTFAGPAEAIRGTEKVSPRCAE